MRKVSVLKKCSIHCVRQAAAELLAKPEMEDECPKRGLERDIMFVITRAREKLCGDRAHNTECSQACCSPDGDPPDGFRCFK